MRSQNGLNAEVQQLIERHNLFVARVTGLLSRIQRAARAIDGKSLAPPVSTATARDVRSQRVASGKRKYRDQDQG